MCWKTDKLIFLDVCNFIAPGFKYSDYLKAFQTELRKGFFPYEWMDNLDKLDYDRLPDREAFYSSLRNESLSVEEYACLEETWHRERMRSVRDLLVWYNNLDVEPFLEALEKQCEVYASKRIDMLKEGLSLPGLSVVWLFKTIGEPPTLRDAMLSARATGLKGVEEAVLATKSVRLFDDENRDLGPLMKDNTVGGPSQVFHREHVRGETLIRPDVYGEEARYCQQVLGVDANALYLDGEPSAPSQTPVAALSEPPTTQPDSEHLSDPSRAERGS